MKLHFWKKDSIYTVFKTLKKVPSYKAVILSFEANHPLFEHERRWYQLQEIIQQHELQIEIYVTSIAMKEFFEKQWIKTIFKHKHILQKRWQYMHDLVFTTQKFHTNLIFKNSYVSYLVIVSEIIVISFILYFFRWLISPNAIINVQPARQIENIVYNYAYVPVWKETAIIWNELWTTRVPYYEWSIPFNHRLTLNVQNIEFSTIEATGKITLYNTTDESISLLPQTTLVTPTDLVFKTDARVTIPPGTIDIPWKNSVTVTAEAFTEKGIIIWELGNIAQDTVLRIKNLPQSMQEKRVYATASSVFKWWLTQAKWSVITNDIDVIEDKILTYMQDKKKEVLQNTIIEKEEFILLYDEYIWLIVEEFITTSNAWDITSFIEWEIKAHITYRYVKQKDITKAVDTYIAKRNSNNLTLLNYDFNSLTFYNIHKETQGGEIYIPTKLNIVRGYNFEDDVNKLVPEMKAKIAGKNSQQVKELLLEYEEIDDVTITISPPWYDTLPDVASRINLRVLKE